MVCSSCPCAKPKIGASIVGVWNLCYVAVPAIVYLIAHVMQNQMEMLRPGISDPFNVFGLKELELSSSPSEDDMDKSELLFYVLYFIPPAVLSFFTGVMVLMSIYLENHALCLTAIIFETFLLIGSGFVLLFMTVVRVEWFFILPLLLPTLSLFYFLWVLTDYKYKLEMDNKPPSSMYDYQK